MTVELVLGVELVIGVLLERLDIPEDVILAAYFARRAELEAVIGLTTG